MQESEKEINKARIGNLGKIIVYLKPYRKSILGVFAALLVSSTAVLSMGVGIKHLVDEGFAARDTLVLAEALGILFIIVILLAAATYARFFLITKVGEQVIADIRRDIYRNLLRLSPSFFEITKPGDLISRITTDTSLLQVVVGSSLSIALRNLLTLLGGVTMLLITSPKLAAYIALMVPVVILPILIMGRRVRNLSKNAQARVASLASHIEETISGIKTVQAYCHESKEMNIFGSKIGEAFSSAMERVRVRAMLTAIVILLAFSAVGSVLFIGGLEVFEGDMTAGSLSSFLFYSMIVASAFGAISEVVGDLQRAGGAAERIFDLLNTKSEITNPEIPVLLTNDSSNREIEFKSVVFYYPARQNIPSMNNLSFKVSSGEHVAIIGASGAGKSTIFQLLLRFYDTTSGDITINGVNIKNLNLSELRSQFAYVSQDPVIFSATAYENIAYGREGATKEEVMAAAKAAYADVFIEKMPEGFDTYLGEKGVRLSGGERQRISIARAILKNPPILLLDEATSALDTESEKLVRDALDALSENRTTIAITHRLSTIEKADRIIVLNQGKIERIENKKQV